jgi:hypothetical protein
MQSKGEDGAVGRKTWAAAGSIHLKDTGMNVKEALGTQVELTSAFLSRNLAMHYACIFRFRVLTVTGHGCCCS